VDWAQPGCFEDPDAGCEPPVEDCDDLVDDDFDGLADCDDPGCAASPACGG